MQLRIETDLRIFFDLLEISLKSVLSQKIMIKITESVVIYCNRFWNDALAGCCSDFQTLGSLKLLEVALRLILLKLRFLSSSLWKLSSMF